MLLTYFIQYKLMKKLKENGRGDFIIIYECIFHAIISDESHRCVKLNVRESERRLAIVTVRGMHAPDALIFLKE